MGKVAAILDFATLGKSSGKFTLAQRMDLLEHCAKVGAFVRPVNIISLRSLTTRPERLFSDQKGGADLQVECPHYAVQRTGRHTLLVAIRDLIAPNTHHSLLPRLDANGLTIILLKGYI